MYTVQHVQIVHVRLFQNESVMLHVTGWGFFTRRLKILVHNVNCLGFCNGNSYMHPVHDTMLRLWVFFILNVWVIINNLFSLSLILKYCNICNDPGNIVTGMVTRFYFKILFILSLICGFI